MLFQTGHVHGTANRTPGWTLHKGKGARSWSYSVVFPEPFTAPPKIFLALRLIDAVNKSEIDFRFACESRFVTDASFTVTASTWSDSKVWSLQVTWIAVDSRVSTLPGSMIQMGTERFHKNDHGYALADGNGERVAKRVIAFPSRFQASPVVLVGYCMMDAVNEKGGEIAVSAEATSVTEGHVELSCKAFQATKQWSSSISWIAIDPQLLSPSPTSQLAAYASRINSSVRLPGYTLHNGEGARFLDKHIAFDPHPFRQLPSVATFLSAFTVLLSPAPKKMKRNEPQGNDAPDDSDEDNDEDADADSTLDIRIVASDEHRSAYGFDLRVSTWNDSKVWDCQASYIAFGAPLVRPNYAVRRNEEEEDDGEIAGRDEDEEDDLPPRANPVPKRQLSIPVIIPQDEEEEEEKVVVKPKGKAKKAAVGPPSTKKQKTKEAEEEEALENGVVAAPGPAIAKKKSSVVAPKAATPPAAVAAAAAPSVDADDEDKDCKICMDEPFNTVLIPCGHMAICFTCAQKILSKGNKECPICKRKVEQIIKTFKA